MTNKSQKTMRNGPVIDHTAPKREPFVMLRQGLLRSDAWRSMSINGSRIVHFLMIEHMEHKGKENGSLKAPYRDLITFGIGARLIASHIAEVEQLGLVRCHRHGLKVASTYTLTWLPTRDGSAATDDWRAYHNPNLKSLAEPKSRNLPAKGDAALPAKGDADGCYLPAKGDADTPKNLPAKGDVLLRSSYQGGDIATEPSVATSPYAEPSLLDLIAEAETLARVRVAA